jgi:hypothetical protein
MTEKIQERFERIFKRLEEHHQKFKVMNEEIVSLKQMIRLIKNGIIN